MDYLLLLGGLILLVFAGDFLVKGAVGSALRFNISTLVVAMTVVSFGTSAPELLVSLQAATGGNPDISIGNVLGSNIANIALVLGITTLIFPIPVSKNTIKLDWPVMFGATLLLWFFARDMVLEFYEGAIFVTLIVIYTIFMIVKSRNEEVEDSDEIKDAKNDSIWKSILFVIGGCIGLVYGSEWFVLGAVNIAKGFGMSELVIGLTIVAFGTSVPELVTSAMAAFRKETDISVGNLIGSNIFNIFVVLGITAMVHPIKVSEQALTGDMFWVSGIALLLFLLMVYDKQIQRWKGAVLLASYVVYVFLLF